MKQKADYPFSLKEHSDLPSAETLYEDVKAYLENLDFFEPAGINQYIPFNSVSTHAEQHDTDRIPGLHGQ